MVETKDKPDLALAIFRGLTEKLLGRHPFSVMLEI
jgi:hypothetical protein